MNTLTFALGVTIIVVMTYAFFRLFDVKDNHLLLTPTEKKKWDGALKGRLGSLVAITNIFGVLTSLATFMFLSGSAKLFGVFSLATGITIALSARITNNLTKLILRHPSIKEKYEGNSQVGGVIASIFWSNDAEGKRLAAQVKWFSIVSIAAIIWLEVSLFTAFSTSFLGLPGILAKFMTASITFFVILYLVLKYGVRGFVFADLLHTPLIVIGGLSICICLGIMAWIGEFNLNMSILTQPILPAKMAGLFVLHVLALNLFQIICTEPHWFRLWLLRGREIHEQRRSVFFTGAIWCAFLFIGFAGFAWTGKVGDEMLPSLLHNLSGVSFLFPFLFWIAAAGALFSTVDTQLYSILLVKAFDQKTGALPAGASRNSRPFLWSLLVSLLFATIYTIVVYLKLPFEKIILVVVPFCTVLLPLIGAKAIGRKATSRLLTLSTVGYVVIALAGFALPELNFWATLSALFAPLALFLWIVLPSQFRSAIFGREKAGGTF